MVSRCEHSGNSSGPLQLKNEGVGEYKPPAGIYIKSVGSLLAWLALVLVAGFSGYQLLFSSFAGYDDEGYVMLSLENVMQGAPLYDETYSQYGPAFFQIQSILQRTFGLEVSHDVTRWKTLVTWLLISIIAALTIWRITRSSWFAAAAFAVVFLHLDRLCMEPGHPQEWCALSLMAIVALTSFWSPTTNKIAGWIIGGLLASIVLTKVNVGVIVALPVGCALLIGCEKNSKARLLFFLSVAASFALVTLIMWKGAFRPATTLLPLVVGISLAASLLVARRFITRHEVQFNQLGAVCGGFVLISLLVVVVALVQGTSLSGLVDGLFLQHIGFTDFFFTPAPLHGLAVAVAVVGFILALSAVESTAAVAFLTRCTLTLLLFAAAATGLLESWTVPTTGFDDRGLAALLTSFAPSLAWVILIPTGQDYFDRTFSARLMVCFLGVFHPLVAYPTPGTQMAIGSVLLLLVGLIAFRDLVLVGLPERARFAKPVIGNLGLGLLCFIVFTSLLVRDVNFGMRRAGMTYLDLPGARQLKLPQEQVDAIHQVVDQLKSESDTFIFAENTRNSFYFWTELTPPTAINATVWPYMLRDDQQQQIVDALEDFERVIVLRDHHEWPLPDDSPLLTWIDKNFRQQSSDGPFSIWSLKEVESDPKLSEHVEPGGHSKFAADEFGLNSAGL